MPLSRELVAAVRARIAERPDIPEAALATELNAPETDVITALPVAMRRRAKASDAPAIVSRASRWKYACASWGAAGSGEGLQPGFPIVPDASIDRLAMADVGSVWFISRPPEKDRSHAVHLYDTGGVRLLSLYIGCDQEGRVSPEDKADFKALWEYYGITPQPNIRRKNCGCSSCSCGGTRH